MTIFLFKNCCELLKDLLIKYEFVIMDKSDIKCSYQQDDEYYLTPVSFFFCQSTLFIKNKINNIGVLFFLLKYLSIVL